MCLGAILIYTKDAGVFTAATDALYHLAADNGKVLFLAFLLAFMVVLYKLYSTVFNFSQLPFTVVLYKLYSNLCLNFTIGIYGSSV